MNALIPHHSSGSSIDDLPEPPHNYEAEQALLGTLFMRNQAIDEVAEFLKPEHFADPTHGDIFMCILTLNSQRRPATPVTIKGVMQDHDGLIAMGGDRYLMDLAGAAASLLMARDYAALIVDLAKRRELIVLGEDLAQSAFMAGVEDTTEGILERHEAALTDFHGRGGETKIATFSEAMDGALADAEAVFKADGKLRGLTTGLTDLDRKLGGLHPTDLIILAGRPSMGKTALAVNIGENAAKNLKRNDVKKVVAFFSLEMDKKQLAGRIMARATGISGHRIRNGPLNSHDMASLTRAKIDMNGLPLRIDDTAALSVIAIRNRARRLARTEGLALIIIDYLQLIDQPRDRARKGPENRTQEVSEITRQLKALAKELQVPVIALSQLSRKVEEREDKRPQLSDLRESGSIEQDADCVMFVYREQYYLERSEPEPGTDKHSKWATKLEACMNVGEALIAKQRHGPIGTVRMHYDSDTTTFTDLFEGGDS